MAEKKEKANGKADPTVGCTLDPALAKLLDAHVEAARAQRRGQTITRASMVREILYNTLDPLP